MLSLPWKNAAFLDFFYFYKVSVVIMLIINATVKALFLKVAPLAWKDFARDAFDFKNRKGEF